MNGSALHNASASKSDLLIKCQWWASPVIRLPPQEEDPKLAPDIPRFGRAFHKTMELVLLNQPVLFREISEYFAVDEARLTEYHHRAVSAILPLLKKRGWDTRPRMVEQKLAYDPFSDTTRVLKSSGERDYDGRRPTEIPGTEDLGLPPETNRPLVVVDWKTGQAQYEAATNAQIQTLALALSRHWKADQKAKIGAIGVIVRIDDEFIELSEGEISNETLDKHRLVLRSKLRAALSNTPAMVPGMHCKYCPALELCPAHRDPLSIVEVADTMLEPGQVAHIYTRLVNAEQLLRKTRDRIKRYVEMNGPLELDNGKIAKIIEYEEENLSKASIIRAKGKLDGEMLIGELRDQGVIDKKSVAQLREVNNPNK